MTKDFASKVHQKKSEPKKMQSRIPRWVWLFTTVVVVGFVGFLYVLNNTDIPGAKTQNISLVDQVKKSTEEAVANLTDKVEQKVTEKVEEKVSEEFTFYKLLPEQEVKTDNIEPVISREELEKINNTAWVLQAASFSQQGDADSLRAELILRGLTDTYIEEIDVTNKGTFFRVMVGPMATRSQMNRARDVLAEARIDPIQKKITLE